MMNLNPLFFDKAFLNKNFASSNYAKSYLFSDIIKIYEENGLEQQDSIQKEILLDINELKNISITNSIKEVVEGIQNALKLLDNYSILSNTNSVSIDKARITSKIFLIDKANLKLFFSKINESLKKKNIDSSSELIDSKILHLYKKSQNNITTYNFVSFNPDAIIESIDNKNSFSVTLKCKDEKLTLVISNTKNNKCVPCDNELKTNIVPENDQKLVDNNLNTEFDSLDNVQSINYDEIINYTQQNEEINNRLKNLIENDYYKLEVVHISDDESNIIYPEGSEVSVVNNYKTIAIESQNKLIDYSSRNIKTVNDFKVAGVIKPIDYNKNVNESFKEYETTNNLSNNVSEKKESQNVVKKVIGLYESAVHNSDLIELNKSEIDFSKLLDGKFSKARIIKDTSEKSIDQFKPVEIKKDLYNKTDTQVKHNEIINNITKSFNATNILKDGIKNYKDEVTIKNTNNKNSISEIKTDQKYDNGSIKTQNIFSKENIVIKNINSRNSSNNEARYSPEYIKSSSSINVDQEENKILDPKLVEKNNKIEVTNYPPAEKLNTKSFSNNFNVDNDKYKTTQISQLSKGSKDNNSEKSDSLYSDKNHYENSDNKIVTKHENNSKDFGKLIDISEKTFIKQFTEYTQIINQSDLNKKILNEGDFLNLVKEKNINEFVNLRESVKVINVNQITEELSNYIRNNDKHSITFRLHPENLGKLTLSIDYIENHLQANIEVENENVKQLIQNNIEQLKNSLQSSGIQLNNVNVSLSSYEQKSLKNPINKKKSSVKSVYAKDSAIEEVKSSSKKMMGYNTYDYLI